MLRKAFVSRCFGWLLLLTLAGNCPVFGGELKVLRGHVPAVVSKLTPLGDLPATNELSLAIGLPLRDEAGLSNFLAEVYEPQSSNYRKFLAPAEFTSRFGPSEDEYETVKAFARNSGFKIIGTHENRMVLDVRANVGDIQRAFHLNLKKFKHPKESRDFYAPDSEPAVDVSLPIADVSGLSNFQLPHPKLIRKKIATANASPKSGSAPDSNHSYLGDDFRAAYMPGTSLTGAGQSVGLLQFDNCYASDVSAYAKLAGGGRTNIPIQTVLIDGYDGTPTSNGNGEVALDVQMAMSMAPGLAKIIVFAAGPSGQPNDILSTMAASNTVKNLSCSWGWDGGPSTTTDNIFKQMAAQGQSFFNASGDSDAFTGGSSSINGVDNPSNANAPSSSPYITQVGGTTLITTGPKGSWVSETVWNWGNTLGFNYDGVGSSGGVSSYYPIPSWQASVSMAKNQGSTAHRNIPDVALTADDVYSISDNGATHGAVGGTSAAAPLWAGLAALANEQAELLGVSSIGLVNPSLYAIGTNTDYQQNFHDVTSGDNTWSSSPSSFFAATGYDLCTGWGTPAGTKLIDALVGLGDALVVSSTNNFLASGPIGGPFFPAIQFITLTNSGSNSLAWSLVKTNPATWLNLTPASGILPAQSTTNVQVNLASTANLLAIGTYTANIQFTNLTAARMQSRPYQLKVLPPLSVSPTNPFIANGAAGGPFSPVERDFIINNLTSTSLVWKASKPSTWLALNQATGTVASAGSTAVTATLTTNANKLKAGTYKTTVTFTDNLKHTLAKVPFTLRIGQNIVSNGGFETGNFAGWTVDASQTQVTNAKPYVHSGSHGAQLGQFGSPGFLSQALTTIPGQNYLISLWVANPRSVFDPTPNELVVQWEGTNVLDLVDLPFMGWTNLQVTVTATQTNSALSVGGRHDQNYLALDDVSVKPVYTPPTSLSVSVAAKLQSSPALKRLSDHVISITRTLVPTGSLASTNILQLAIGLPLRDPAGMETFLQQLYDPSSTNYHNYLTPDEVTARFGPTEQDYAAVKNFAASNGFQIIQEHGNRLLLDVTANATDVERAFHVKLKVYHHPSENRDFYAPDTDPTVDAGLPVLDVQGLSDFPRPHPKLRQLDTKLVSPQNGSAPDGSSLFGNDFRNAYAPGVPLTGAGQIVGLFQADGFYSSDVTKYAQQTGNGRTNIVIQTILIDNYSGAAGGNNSEVALDIEMAMAMAPGLSKIIVFEGNPSRFIPNDVLNTMAASNTVKNLSSSWGWSGGPSSTTDNIFKTMSAQGQTYFNASGDSDAFPSGYVDNSTNTTVPSSSPYIVQVGGTTLTMNGTGASYASETVWNWGIEYGSANDGKGTSGGISSYYAIPGWQTNVSMALNNGSTTFRNIPDVALTADHVYVYYNNGGSGWFGGTSCAAPLWAGFIALVNQQATLAGKSPVGFINPAIYSIATNANYNTVFNDTTTGNNTWTGSPTNFPAAVGYDLCTGLGTPNGANFINALVPSKPFMITQPSSLNVSNSVNVTFSTSVGGNDPLFYQWTFNGTNLVDGGKINGSATNILSLSAVAPTNAGNYSLIVTNIYGAVTSSVAVLNVGVPPAVTTQPTNLTISSGSNAVFSIAASGTTNLAYQWYKNGSALANGSGITGVTSNVLTLSGVTTNSAGNYFATVTNAYGNATSSVASLTVVVPPTIVAAGWTLLAESATPTNNSVDPGETVTLNFALQNQGTISTTNLVATLLASSNILAPSAAQTYGAIAGNNATVSKAFTFTAAGGCGSSITASLQLQDGASSLGTVNFTITLGALASAQSFAQNFDSVTVPALPSGWSSVNVSGTANSWTTVNSAADTAPNSAFISDSASTGANALVTPAIPISTTNAQLTFRHNFSFEYRSTSTHPYRDGGVLEIQIGNGGFTDILTAGGSFVTNGYNGGISTAQNALGTRSAWIGTSPGWQTVTVNLPASAAGQNIQLRWNCGTDNGNSGTGAVGWYVDSIAISDAVINCLSVFTDLATSQTIASSSQMPGQNLVYTLAVTNLGPQSAANVIVTDTVPANATFVSAPGGNYAAGSIVFPVGTLAASTTTNFTVTLSPAAGTVFTNAVSVSTITPEVTTANNFASLVTTQVLQNPAAITTGPATQTIQCGGNASFSVTATGTTPLSIQWSLDSQPITGATNTSLQLTNLHLPSHLVSVTVTNLYGSATSNAVVNVIDTLAPVVTLNGNSVITNELGSAFADPGATSSDTCAGTVPVTVSGSVNTSVVGTNTLTYTATDGNGNTNNATRTVIVRDTTPPVISWSFTNLVLAADSNCVTAMPDMTGTNFILASDLSGSVIITQSPTNNAVLPLGTNSIVITVADASGNASYSTNQIVVQDQTPPQIVAQPQSQTNTIGTTATFNFLATACTPLTFQWYSNSVALAAATNNVLTLSNLTTNMEANYFVVASATGGASTSSVASLTVTVPSPVINSVSVNPAVGFTLQLSGIGGYQYVLEATTNLMPPSNWLPLATNTLGSNGVWQFTDSSATNFPRQFYRLRQSQ